ncbi:methylamine utilization protein [Alteromonas sp. H39]|uniref:methylamine utilization protein n=1 Tax=Alteromonas sp. H39 TaxID=3389876 RepID=UPI0039E1B688
MIAAQVTGVSGKSLRITDQNGSALSDVIATWPAEDDAATSSTTVAIVDQVDRQFVPHVKVIEQGQQVSFPNSDNIRHHVYSFSAAKTFEIKLYSGEPSDPVTFATPGIVVLGCNIHDQMIGYIYVNDGSEYSQSGKDGMLYIPEDVSSVTLWHPGLDLTQTRRKVVELNQDTDSVTLPLTVPQKPEPKTFGKRKFGG